MTAKQLVLTADVRSALLDHAREGAAADSPVEVCGVLGGERDASGSPADRVTAHRPVANVSTQPRIRYELDPEETLAAIDGLEATGVDLVGFYHSHPEGPSKPSATDHAEAAWEGYVYCIVLPDKAAVRAWRWTGELFDPLETLVQ